MSQAKKIFTCMCLNNWGGINHKVLEFNEYVNLFSGKSGSGKSTVMDAIQVILYGSLDVYKRQSLHCDELTHLCRVPYELGNLHKKEETDAAQKGVAETDRIQEKEGKGLPLDEDGYLTGSTG